MSTVKRRGRPARRRGTGTARGSGRRRRGSSGSRVYSRQSAERWLASLLPPATSTSELFDHVPEQLDLKPDVKTHVICGNVVQESSAPFECGLRARRLAAEPGQSARDASPASPRQEPSVVDRDPRTAFDSRKVTPLRVSVVTRARRHEPATTAATSSQRRRWSSTPSGVAKPNLSVTQTPPPPPLLAPCVASAKLNPASIVVCVCGGHQPTAASRRNYDPNRSFSTTNQDNQAPNECTRSASEATAHDDAPMREVSDALAASSPSPRPCCPCLGQRTIAYLDRLSEVASQAATPGPSMPAQAPMQETASAKDWTVEDVVRYVKRIPRCAWHAEKFREEEVDGRALLLLGIRHLTVHMGLPVGPAVKILHAIRELRKCQRPN
ncbi:polyhomeotic-like protein 1 [Rhipicephalus sanguineus]|uniref:SAM domain-containing protein n=1 Tax=Rhipicephalus sanguineus TaxID=34632 RepID=A0A9D4QE57_RHISA|nr:polyhomeotic-like protein 1 [Rhipicephalus sanguineus]KAH7975978.1 hypothetical protein HPB52_007206 [Rhipicephalus sanguineus]